MKRRPLLPLALLTFASLVFTQATAQTAVRADVSSTNQNLAASLAALPEADTLIYINPRRILNDAMPRVLPASDLAELRKGLEDVKKDAGVDLSNLDYVVVALRFRKPAADLSFAPPEVMAVASGDLSADSLITMVQLALQEKAREETHGTRKIAITRIDPIAEAAEKNPLLKSFSEIGFMALNTNTIAIGTIGYLKAAVDAANGDGRVANTAISSLVRDPNALISAAGSPLAAFAKSFGLLGTQETSRDPRCETSFGNFYAAVTQSGNAFNVSGAMNADNPDTAKIINGLLSGLMQTVSSSLPEKERNVVNGIKLTNNESEVVISGSIPEATIAELIKQQTTKTTTTAPSSSAPVKKKVVPRKRRTVKRKTVSDLGKILDPLADKLMIIAVLIMLAAMDRPGEPGIPAWLVVVVVARETAVTIIRGIALAEGIVMASEDLGKYKFLLQATAVFSLLLHYTYFGIDFYAVGMYFLWVATFLGVWSGVNYHLKFFRLLKAKVGSNVELTK